MSNFRYIKVTGSILWGVNVLTKEMLGMVATRQYDTIIDLMEMTYFDADDNAWKPIEGTE